MSSPTRVDRTADKEARPTKLPTLIPKRMISLSRPLPIITKKTGHALVDPVAKEIDLHARRIRTHGLGSTITRNALSTKRSRSTPTP